MIIINYEKCIGCGMCVADCSTNALSIKAGHLEADNEKCFECGHCVAVCPESAASVDGYDDNEILSFENDSFQVNSENLLNLIKYKRSIRQYEDSAVEPKKIKMLIEAGRYTATAGNSQLIRYILLKDRLDEIRLKTMKALHDLAVSDSNYIKLHPQYKEKFTNMYVEYQSLGKDRLFFNAPLVIVAVADNSKGYRVDVDGSLAMRSIELMAASLGLGSCYVGNFVTACDAATEIKSLLNIKDNEKIVTVLTVGYPATKYYRTVNRRIANVTEM